MSIPLNDERLTGHAEDIPGGLVSDYGPGQLEQIVRAIVPRGQTVSTYAVLIAAAREAVRATPVRADGLTHPTDVLKTLCAAVDAAGEWLPELRFLRAMRERFEDLARHVEHVGPCKACGDWAVEIRDRIERRDTTRPA